LISKIGIKHVLITFEKIKEGHNLIAKTGIKHDLITVEDKINNKQHLLKKTFLEVRKNYFYDLSYFRKPPNL
jgi:hypothetical protein